MHVDKHSKYMLLDVILKAVQLTYKNNFPSLFTEIPFRTAAKVKMFKISHRETIFWYKVK